MSPTPFVTLAVVPVVAFGAFVAMGVGGDVVSVGITKDIPH
jgi:hypothetical protein